MGVQAVAPQRWPVKRWPILAATVRMMNLMPEPWLKQNPRSMVQRCDDEAGIRRPKVGRIPKARTKRELDEHLPLHMPYKAWCPICVAGKVIYNQSRAAKEEEEEKEITGVTINLD